MGREIIINLDFDTPGHPGSLSEAYSTGVFDVITEGTRKHFRKEEEACARHCFFRLDEECQQYITLDEVHPACFNIFVRACEAGLAEYQTTGITAWGVQHEVTRVQGIAWEWSELIKKLRADPRYMAAARGKT
ncbi:hypothetical protein [Variovorax guangxiensis]|uniref:hypothetical protein n=1 Tax=Variovorax guangxiensis TaxID=1775474 RepID=UPI002865CC78|nr:hypothetical protein [Variovorax guangxiensis]MDR6856820.1 hypothetical protein [Variovorax guangxiensis]